MRTSGQTSNIACNKSKDSYSRPAKAPRPPSQATSLVRLGGLPISACLEYHRQDPVPAMYVLPAVRV